MKTHLRIVTIDTQIHLLKTVIHLEHPTVKFLVQIHLILPPPLIHLKVTRVTHFLHPQKVTTRTPNQSTVTVLETQIHLEAALQPTLVLLQIKTLLDPVASVATTHSA